MTKLKTGNGSMDDAFARVDELIDKAIALKDFDVAVGAIKQLEELRKIAGWSKAYLFYRLRENWHVFEIADDFQDTVVTMTKHHPWTVTMYLRSWEALLGAPAEEATKMLSHNIGDYYPVANAVAQGYKIKQDDWEQLTDGTMSSTDIGDYVRDEIKEAEPRKMREKRPFVDREGSINIVDKEGEWLYVGHVEINNRHPLVEQWVNRILDRANIGRQ